MINVMDIAEAVKLLLNEFLATDSFESGIEAVKSVLPKATLAELANLKVTVVPNSEIDITRATRSESQIDYKIDVGIQKKLSSEDLDDQVSDLIEFVCGIIEYLSGKSFTISDKAVRWARVENNPVYDREHLKTDRVFTSLITITYRTVS